MIVILSGSQTLMGMLFSRRPELGIKLPVFMLQVVIPNPWLPSNYISNVMFQSRTIYLADSRDNLHHPPNQNYTRNLPNPSPKANLPPQPPLPPSDSAPQTPSP